MKPKNFIVCDPFRLKIKKHLINKLIANDSLGM